MSDRTVAVSLTANVTGYLQGMDKAKKSTENVGKSAEAVKAKFEAQGKAMTEIGAGMMGIGVIAGVGVALAIAKFAEFDQAMSNVNAATHETADNMALLRDAALDAGGRTVFSAAEAANAIEELGKAGVSTADILDGGLNGALDLAAAGGLGVADAAGIAAVALKTFKLEGSDMSHVADLLAAGAGKAMGDVTDLSAALSQSGQVAASTGVSIEETTATLAAFASQGLLGSDAGTSFKSMLQRLTPQSAEAATAMDDLGISAYDAQGNFIGMSKFAGVLQQALKDKTVEERNAAMATIFGSDAVRAATVLYSEGEKGIAGWTAAVDDQGYAAETAAARLDNLRGDVEALGGAFDTALIQSGSAANDALRTLVQSGTTAVDMFNDADPVIQQAALTLGVAVTVIGLTGGAFMVAVPKVAAFRTSLAALNTTIGKTSLAGGLIGIALAAATAVVFEFAAASAEAKADAEALADTLDSQTGAITDNTRAWVADKLQKDGSIKSAKELGISAADLVDAYLQVPAALKSVEAAMKDARNLDNREGKLFDSSNGSVVDLANSLGTVDQVLRDGAPATEDARTRQQELKDATLETTEANEAAAPAILTTAESYLAQSDAATSLTDEILNLVDSMNILNGIGQDASSANIAYQESLDGVDEQIRLINAGTEGYARTLDIGTEAGRLNRGMLDDLAGSNQTAAAAQYELDGNTANYRATLEAGHQAVYDRAVALGANADEANRIADEISKIPGESEWKVIAVTEDATRRLQKIQDLINGIGRTSQLHISTGSGGIGGLTMATGGTISGPGTGTSDSIPVCSRMVKKSRAPQWPNDTARSSRRSTPTG